LGGSVSTLSLKAADVTSYTISFIIKNPIL